MSNQLFDDSFRKMAVELSYARGLVKEVADELGIPPSRLSKWRRRFGPANSPAPLSLSAEQEIKKLRQELKQTQLERDILKKAVSIFSRGDGTYSAL
jgi:transposase